MIRDGAQLAAALNMSVVPTMLTALTKSVGVMASSSAAWAGVVDHTMLLNPSLTGNKASGPLGRKTCRAEVLGVAVATVATKPLCL